MGIKNIHTFLNTLRHHAGAIWLENDLIKLLVPPVLQNQVTKDLISNHREQLISLLKENNIFSKAQFLNVIILKDSSISNYPLSAAQERLWFIEQYEQGTNAYHIPMALELAEGINIEGIKYALSGIVERHEVLRSTIEQDQQQQGIQVVQNKPLEIEQIQVSHPEDLETLLTTDINRPFNLAAEYPIRVSLYHITGSLRSVLLITTHHIAGDGWSVGIFQKELIAGYEAFIAGDENFKLPPLAIQYKDFAIWQRNYLSSEVLENQLQYWKGKLSGFQTLSLPLDFPRPATINYLGAGADFLFDADTSDRLRKLVKEQGTTLHNVLITAFYILLGKYSGQNDITVGSPIANRHYSQLQELIGVFVNTQANRVILNESDHFIDLLRQVHKEQIIAQSNQDLPFERLLNELEVIRDPSRHPIFQAMFVVQNFGKDQRTAKERERYFKPFQGSVSFEVEKFDLSVFIDDSEQEISGRFNYASSLFKKETIEQMVQHFILLVDRLISKPDRPYQQVSLLGRDEFEHILQDFGGALQPAPQNETLHAVLTKHALQYPEQPALLFAENHLSYQELDQKSNSLARTIREKYLKLSGQALSPDTLIPICMDRGTEMITAILAVLKAGAAYVPVDPAYPQHRIDYILADTNAQIVLSQKHITQAYPILLPEEKIVLPEHHDHESTAPLPEYSAPESLAYVIYTSGTTGKPKG
ncbi:non-ribosomal peptide synthetase, partial [Pedobacter sp. KBW06]|uniref:non-ribosomal peptide synthetase n=1 Tax=Pedobacter sp. KBW06 TaxID=2153359 RepID=UPI0013156907